MSAKKKAKPLGKKSMKGVKGGYSKLSMEYKPPPPPASINFPKL